jgi:receptor-type tyrosine-protein phosphatase A
MVWEQRCEVILMLVKVQIKKAEQYWPESANDGDTLKFTFNYDEYKVKMVGDSVSVSYGLTMRVFNIIKNDKDGLTSEHTVTHYYYDQWPDHGPPASFRHFGMLHDALKGPISGTQSPVIVHCSAGVGRTGTFITIDRFHRHLFDNVAASAVSDKDPIMEFIMECRRHRPWFVETEEQFIFVYEYLWWSWKNNLK